MIVAMPLGGTDFGRSGIGVYVRALLPRLRDELGETSELVVLGTAQDFEAYRDELYGIRRALVPVDRPLLSAAWYATQVGACARALSADVLLLPAGNRRVAWRPGLPTVGVVHDLAQLHVREKYDALRMFYFDRVMVPALRGMTRLVAISDATAKDLRTALGANCPPMDLVPNGVDSVRFAPLPSDDAAVKRARARANVTGKYLLYAARLEHPGKNHLRLLRAFAASHALRDHTLVLAGKDWGALSLIQEEIAKAGIASRVRLLGFVEDEYLPGLVAGADAVVMLGLHEGFGLPALEALAAGRPVCASNTGALPEVVGPYAALVDPLDEAAIGRALEAACFDPTLRARAQNEGPAWAQARDWSHTARGLIASCRAARTTARG